MSAHHVRRLARLEQTQQDQQGMPRLFVLRDNEPLPWDAPENCLIVRLSTKWSEEEWTRRALESLPHNQRLSPDEAWQQWWNRPVEREAPPPPRQKR